MSMYDPTRLLVAYTNASETCRTPHFSSDLLASLTDDEVTFKRLSFQTGYNAEFVINGSLVTIREIDDRGNFSVRYEDKFVVAACARSTLVPTSVSGMSLLELFSHKYGLGERIVDLDVELSKLSLPTTNIQWNSVTYIEASPIICAIKMLLPETSVS